MKHKYIKNTFIKNPRTDCEYHLRSSGNEVIITFTGNKTCTGNKTWSFIDIATSITQTFNPHVTSWYSGSDIMIFPKEALPISLSKTNLPPIFAYTQLHGTRALKQIKYNLKNIYPAITAEAIDVPRCINKEIEEQYKKEFNIVVACGDFPIFYEDKRPTYQFLASVYELFIKFNNIDKLNMQYRSSAGLCHVRAQFSHQFLQMYFHLPTVKVYKFWNSCDWKSFADNKSWSYHTATAVIDDQYRLWIWDPWVGLNVTLLTLKQWLYRNDEPAPIKLMITSNTIICDIEQGRRPDGLLFMRETDIMDNENCIAFQAISRDVFPNHPERPILSSRQTMLGLIRHGLFSLPSQEHAPEIQKSPQNRRNFMISPI